MREYGVKCAATLEEMSCCAELYNRYFSGSSVVRENQALLGHTFCNSYGVYSRRSFCFGDMETVAGGKAEKIEWAWQTLGGVFGFCIECKDARKWFDQSVNGDGCEYTRINRLHSSSLLAFLCFHSAALLDGAGLAAGLGLKSDSFELEFESRNHLGPSERFPRPSNIDVKLTAGERSLNCESKCTEYLTVVDHTKCDISTEYEVVYGELFGRDGLVLCGDQGDVVQYERRQYNGTDKGKRGMEALLLKSNKPHYLHGIKQMISHWMGIRYEIELGQYRPGEVDLCEIVFDWDNLYKDRPCMDYSKVYAALARRMNHLDSRIKVRPGLLTYQDVFAGIDILPAVRDYYFH